MFNGRIIGIVEDPRARVDHGGDDEVVALGPSLLSGPGKKVSECVILSLVCLSSSGRHLSGRQTGDGKLTESVILDDLFRLYMLYGGPRSL